MTIDVKTILRSNLPEGPPGATGATGPIGATGPGGEGSTGATGPSGIGSTGATGVGGVGATGASGLDGASGPQGATGATGPLAGISGQFVYNDASSPAGTEYLSYKANGQIIANAGISSADVDTGTLLVDGGVGITGNLNAGNVIAGGVRTTSSSTPPSNPTVGDIWYSTTNDKIYRRTSDGTSTYWVDLYGLGYSADTDIIGATGATGPYGGPPGSTGATGETGATGPSGGPVGATGAKGSTGSTGATGVQGSTGATGVKGTTGATGFNGSTGATGITATVFLVAASDEVSTLTVGGSKVTFRAPFAMTITQIPRASLTAASVSGTVTCDINVNGTSILGANKLSIDQGEKTSLTAATPTTLANNPTNISNDSEFSIDVDGAGASARGLKVMIYYNAL